MESYLKWISGISISIKISDAFSAYVAVRIKRDMPHWTKRMLKASGTLERYEEVLNFFDELDTDEMIVLNGDFIERSTLWHEVGHIIGDKEIDPIKSEIAAHLWALKRARDKRFWQIEKELISHLDRWIGEPIYEEAKIEILKYIATIKRRNPKLRK